MREMAMALALALVASGCDEGSAASPTFESSSTLVDSSISEGDASADAGEAATFYAVCPPGLDASFGSIFGQLLTINSVTGASNCGANNGVCHSTVGAMNSNGLDFSLEAGAVYAELLGPDGGGQLAVNVAGSAKVLRVAPGDAGASMLAIKLTITSSADPQYGSGMPQNDPGSVCPATVEAVQAWINAGAANN
jgi:hypothetical protein